jgi:predicted lipoprotein with Yx(FWY)xxD motif
MRRIWLSGIAVIVVLGLAAAVAGAHGSAPTVQLRKTSLGKILVNSRGFTLYAFTPDKRNTDHCQNVKGCLSAWPALTSSGKPTAGPGIKSSLLGTIKLKDGARQVTYAGHPLYTYAGDRGPGQTSYVNFKQYGGRWPALNASGGEVK